MTQQPQMKNRWAGQAEISPSPGNQPIFFFDGDFWTWGLVEQRAQLNRAIATHLAKHPAR